MVVARPVDQIHLTATSAADDAGFVALSDLSVVVEQAGLTGHYRLVGGHMVSLLAARWQLDLYRETQDTDLGVPKLSLNSSDLLEKLVGLGYHPKRSNRYFRTLVDLPVGLEDQAGSNEAIIDLLVPSYTSRARKNVTVGNVVTIEVPGLAEALNSDPVRVDVSMARLNGEVLRADLLLPNEGSALALKALAWKARGADKDAVDVWRCLEIANAAGVSIAGSATGDSLESAAVIKTAFGAPDGEAMRALAQHLSLSASARDERYTRIAALIQRVVS